MLSGAFTSGFYRFPDLCVTEFREERDELWEFLNVFSIKKDFVRGIYAFEVYPFFLDEFAKPIACLGN